MGHHILVVMMKVSAIGCVLLVALRLVEYLHDRLHRIRCVWCYRPYAIYERSGSRCCRHCAHKIDARISEIIRSTPVNSRQRSIVPIARKQRRG